MENLFNVCVDNTSAPTIYKLVQLKSLLRGEAEELLEGLGWEALIMNVHGGFLNENTVEKSDSCSISLP